MKDESKICIDENKRFQFDFTNALHVYRIHDYYQYVPGSLLSDVDFIVEREEDILLIEYKNCDIAGAAKSDAFYEKIMKDEHHQKIARKYYDSLLFVLTQKILKPVHFIYILECKKAAPTERGEIKIKIAKKLPFLLQQHSIFQNQWINDFSVFSIEEWNQEFPDYLVSPYAS